MTIQTRTVEVPVVQTIGESVTCDICKQMYKMANKDGHLIDWGCNNGDQIETGLVLVQGDGYARDYNMTYHYWHICPRCFREKMLPWLENMGAQPTIEEYS